MTERTEESNLVAHARAELTRAGFFENDSDYDGMIGTAVLELIQVFSSQGHSGMSAMLALDVFNILAHFGPLGPITNDPDEWTQVTDAWAGTPELDGSDAEPALWQSRRNPKLFSHDGGKTYYSIEDPLDSHGNLPTYTSKEHTSA